MINLPKGSNNQQVFSLAERFCFLSLFSLSTWGQQNSCHAILHTACSPTLTDSLCPWVYPASRAGSPVIAARLAFLVCVYVVFCCFATGGAGEKLLMPGTGFLTVGAASTLAFCQVLREEYPEVPCKLNQVRFQRDYTAGPQINCTESANMTHDHLDLTKRSQLAAQFTCLPPQSSTYVILSAL